MADTAMAALAEFVHRRARRARARVLIRWTSCSRPATVHADIGTTANIYAHPDTTDLEAALRARGEDYGMASRNRSDRNRAFCGEYGGGGNRTRVPRCFGESVYVCIRFF